MPDETIFSGNARDNTELLKAWAGTTLAYAIFQVGAPNILRAAFLQSLLIAAVVCGLGFVLHELGHRIVARRFGAQAHFVANNGWLLISILIAFAGIFIAAPGAVWHRGYLSERQSGLIALAGPAANLALSLLFLLALPVIFVAGFQSDWIFILCLTGVSLNAWLGLFNMLPAGPFDGARVLAWSPLYFGITVVIGIVMTFVIASRGNLIAIWQFMISLLGG